MTLWVAIPKRPKECLEINKLKGGLAAPALTLCGPILPRMAKDSNAVYGKHGGACVLYTSSAQLMLGEFFFCPMLLKPILSIQHKPCFILQPCLAKPDTQVHVAPDSNKTLRPVKFSFHFLSNVRILHGTSRRRGGERNERRSSFGVAGGNEFHFPFPPRAISSL